jgi:hypothetical protein
MFALGDSLEDLRFKLKLRFRAQPAAKGVPNAPLQKSYPRRNTMRASLRPQQECNAAALSTAMGFSASATNAAPARNMLETLRANARASSTSLQIRHRRGYRYHRRQDCWWGDRVVCGRWW